MFLVIKGFILRSSKLYQYYVRQELMKSSIKYFLFAILLIIIDQVIKLWMHFVVIPDHFGEMQLIPGFLKLHYITNKGMAFGMELGGSYGKLALTLFRLVAMGVIAWYLAKLAKNDAHRGLLWSLSAILAGAIGNVIDSTFYGVFLNNAPFDAPSPWFHGQVIDMFYANGLDGYWPDWIPFLGGTYNNTPIFNFADACIFCGVVCILVFQKTFIDSKDETKLNLPSLKKNEHKL
jgi:signal peptidase II